MAFTMDTYTHVLTSHKVDSMALMEELYDMGQTQTQEVSYMVVATPLATGGFTYVMPDFPNITLTGQDIYQDLITLRERLEEELLVNVCPSEPIPASQIALQPGQFLLQIQI